MNYSQTEINKIDTGFRIGSRLVKFVILSGGRIGLLPDGMFDLIKTMSKAEFDQLIEMVSDPKLKEGWKTFMYGVGVTCQMAGFAGAVLLSSPPQTPTQQPNQYSISSAIQFFGSFGSVNAYAQSIHPSKCQEALAQAMSDYMGIEFKEPVNIPSYGFWQKGKNTKK